MRSESHTCTFIYIARRKIDHLAQLLIIFFTWVSLSLLKSLTPGDKIINVGYA